MPAIVLLLLDEDYCKTMEIYSASWPRAAAKKGGEDTPKKLEERGEAASATSPDVLADVEGMPGLDLDEPKPPQDRASRASRSASMVEAVTEGDDPFGLLRRVGVCSGQQKIENQARIRRALDGVPLLENLSSSQRAMVAKHMWVQVRSWGKHA
eukprot:SAG11_NODE_8053_length_1065_cov_0.908903_2_plen_154_part_00